MKKIILILVLVLPVVVTVLIYMVAGFIIREKNVPELSAITRNYANLNTQNILVSKGSSDFVISEMTQGQRIRLNNYLNPQPARARFIDLTFAVIYGGGNLDNENDALYIDWVGYNAYLVANREFVATDFQGLGVEVWIMGTGGNILSTIFVEDIVAVA